MEPYVLRFKNKVFLLKALSLIKVVKLNEWLVSQAPLSKAKVFSKVKLPYRFDGLKNDVVTFRAKVLIEESPSLRPYLLLKLNSNAQVYVNGEPYFGVDAFHRELPLNKFGHVDLVIEVFNRGLHGELIEDVVFSDAVIAYRDSDIYEFAVFIDSLVDFINLLPKDDYLRIRLEGIVSDVLRMIPIEGISPEKIDYLLGLALDEPLLRQAHSLLRGLLSNLRLLAKEAPSKLRDAGFREPKYVELKGRVIKAKERLLKLLNESSRELGKVGSVLAQGHSHIDLAWLWPPSMGLRNVLRTVSTALRLLELYPEFTFTMTSALYYRWLKENHPELFRKIKEYVKRGRWSLSGGFWVEFDANNLDGESLVRQFLYGQRFFAKEFGKYVTICWLPDTFGFPPSLPQILVKSGVKALLIAKLTWNEYNEFPHHLFDWVGIDGTTIRTLFIPRGLTIDVRPKALMELWSKYSARGLLEPAIYVYGYGDGGGGPTEEMILKLNIYGKAPGLPKIRHGVFDEVVSKALAVSDDLVPRWYGEIYLENHRGTYTTNIEIKKLIHDLRIILRQLEILSSITHALGLKEYPQEKVRQLWEVLLTNQFHDIITGAVNYEGHEVAVKKLKQAINEASKELNEVMNHLVNYVSTKGDGVLLFNTLPWGREVLTELVIDKGKVPTDNEGRKLPTQVIQDLGDKVKVLVPIMVPPMGYTTIYVKHGELSTEVKNPALIKETHEGFVLENKYLRLIVSREGTIISIYDKEVGREVLKGESNVFMAYEDRPYFWDAWNIDKHYEEVSWRVGDVVKCEVVERGPLRVGIRFVKRFRESTIEQTIYLSYNSRRVDVVTTIDWHERNVLLKVWFEPNVNTYIATYEVPYGVYERPTHRNTSWEEAKYEVPGLNWVDMSEGDYGLAIINNGARHGYTTYFNKLSLTLIKSPTYPNPLSDYGKFAFTYSIYPHKGDWRVGNVPKVAKELNEPLITHRTTENPGGVLSDEQSFIEVNKDNVIIEVLKTCEDMNRCLVIRTYEAKGLTTKARVTMNIQTTNIECYETDLLEVNDEPLRCAEGIELEFKPYEIKTLKIFLSPSSNT